MKNEEKDPPEIGMNSPDADFDPAVSFLQVPVKIKDQVKEFIDSIVDETDAKKLASKNTVTPFQSQGCFFVIALERIEEITEYLKKAINHDENDIEMIRADIQKALNALQSQ